jgi:hypothetical protein
MSDAIDDSGGNSDQAGKRDCFAPPEIPCECCCLHCNRVFMSDQIWFQKVINARDGFEGFWMCPTPNCNGAGFSFDIFPTDPNHPANDGWVEDDEDYEDIEFDEQGNEIVSDTPKEYDPEEPHYAQLDEMYGDEDDDLEGEEWKHGLAPGERPPEPPWAAEARQRWEEEQAKYDQPDERPRVRDWSDCTNFMPPQAGSDGEWGDIAEGDIPF